MKRHKIKPLALITVLLSVAVITYFVLNILFSPYWDSVYPPFGYFSFSSVREAKFLVFLS